MGSLQEAWAAILSHPLFWVGMTLAAYQFGLALYERTKLAVFHPVLVSTPVLVLLIWLAGEDYAHYRDAVSPLLVLLGPATVALAIPLYLNLRRIRSFFWPVVVCLLVGGAFATLMAILLAWLLGAEPMIMMTLAPKSVTSPIAMLVAEQIG
ncbi:MAG: LrgB family protein, partial [Pseudomonas neustonica]